jgi:hypothetical protein
VFEVRPAITRALLITGGVLALSAAGEMAFTPGLARASGAWSRNVVRTALRATVPGLHGSSRASEATLLQQSDVLQGSFCPVRPAGTEHTALIPANPTARMSIDPRTDATVDSSAIAADSLLAPAPAICRPKPELAPAQSSVSP